MHPKTTEQENFLLKNPDGTLPLFPKEWVEDPKTKTKNEKELESDFTLDNFLSDVEEETGNESCSTDCSPQSYESDFLQQVNQLSFRDQSTHFNVNALKADVFMCQETESIAIDQKMFHMLLEEIILLQKQMERNHSLLMHKFDNLDLKQCKKKRTEKNRCRGLNRRQSPCKGYCSKKSHALCHAHQLLYLENNAKDLLENGFNIKKDINSHLFKNSFKT